MRNVVAPTKAVSTLQIAYEAVSTRDQGVPGMCLVYGRTGAGKTTAITWLANRTNGIYVRATSGWTPTSMLAKVVAELGGAPMQRRADMLDWIAQQMLMTQRPLFVDEADYLVGHSNGQMLESLRDLHDLSSAPVVLIGMSGIERRVASARHAQTHRRIAHWVEFEPADLEDAERLARSVCEVELDGELLTALHREAKGSVGLMAVALARIEALAKANGWPRVSAEQWGDRPLFLGRRPAITGEA